MVYNLKIVGSNPTSNNFKMRGILANTFYNTLTARFKKVDFLKCQREGAFLNKLSDKQASLEDMSGSKEFSYNRIFKNNKKTFELGREKFLISYIITVTFLKANTNINVSDIKGNVKLSFTSGSVNLIGKQKKNRLKSFSRLVSLLSKKATFLKKNTPVAIHLRNVNFSKFLILKRLKINFFIRIVKSYNLSPYNGCRKKKVRRKKYVKKFK